MIKILLHLQIGCQKTVCTRFQNIQNRIYSPSSPKELKIMFQIAFEYTSRSFNELGSQSEIPIFHDTHLTQFPSVMRITIAILNMHFSLPRQMAHSSLLVLPRHLALPLYWFQPGQRHSTYAMLTCTSSPSMTSPATPNTATGNKL